MRIPLPPRLTVLVIFLTALSPAAASAATSEQIEGSIDTAATWIRGQWQIENGLHWVRDVTLGEDLSQIHAGNAPQVMATLRNLVISLHRLAGATNIAAALRHHARSATRPLELLGIT